MVRDKTKRHAFIGVMSAQRWRGLLTWRRQGRYEQLRQIIPTVRTLKTDINILYHNVLTLQQANQVEDHTYSRMLRAAAKNIFALHTWSRMLSDNLNFLLCAPWWELSHCGRGQLTSPRGYLKIIHTQPDFIFDDTFSLSRATNALLAQTSLKAHRIDNSLICIRLFVPYRDENQTQAIIPQLLALIFRIYLSASWRARIKLHFDDQIAQMPSVLYHAHTVLSLLSTVASSLRLDPDEGDEAIEKRPMMLMHLKVYGVPDGATFRLTMQGYRLLPQTWEQWRQNTLYEALRELGGDIEPLTWDEGYGQGVIVRLPWAKSSTEKERR